MVTQAVKKIKAIQYDGSNIAQLIDNFGLNPEVISVNYADKTAKISSYNSKKLMLGQWLVVHGDGYAVVEDAIVQSILSIKS